MTIYHILRYVIIELPDPLVRIFERIRERKLMKSYTNTTHKQNENLNVCVSMFDERVNPGGLADRIFGIVSVYQACKDLKLSFKIYHKYPFDLAFLLSSNIVEWEMRQDELVRDKSVKIVFIRSLLSNKNQKRQNTLKRILSHNTNTQIQVYSNLDSFDSERFQLLFNELFKPSPILQENIDFHIGEINGKYVSVTFRFQQLLGDFKEGQFEILDETKRLELIQSCIEQIEAINCRFPNHKILVTSDSSTFLERADEFPYTYIIPGKVVHMAYDDSAGIEAYMKSFIDLYMIAGAEKVFSVRIGKMYNSGFPRLAAKIGNKPFEYICS